MALASGNRVWLRVEQGLAGQGAHPALFIAEGLSGQAWQVFLRVNHNLLYTVINIVVRVLISMLFPVNCSFSQLLIFSFCPFHRREGWEVGQQGAVCGFLFSGST